MKLRPVQILVLWALTLFVADLRAQSLTDYGAVPPLTKPQSSQDAANEKLDFHTDVFTGRFNYQVPIKVPPARGGSEPGVGLQYSSATKNGWCGVGWDLDMGSIQRDTRAGVPVSGLYSDAFGFTFSVAGKSGRLINVGGSNYCPQVNTDLLKLTYSNSSWIVIDKSGQKYNFGETAASRMTNFFGTFRWALSSIRDPNGNKTLLTYTNDGGQLYLQGVFYNGSDSSPAITINCSVLFDLSNRTDVVSALNSGYEIITQKRLGSIRVFNQGQLARRYQLQYGSSASTGRSLLQSVTQYGADNTTALPAQSFGYSVQAQSFQPIAGWNITSQTVANDPAGIAPGTQDAQLVDINGDGLPDWVTRPLNAPYDHFNVQLNNGGGFGSIQSWSPVSEENGDTTYFYNSLDHLASDGTTTLCSLVDMDGDLLPDRVAVASSGSPNHFQVQKNTGTGFSSIATVSETSGANYPGQIGETGGAGIYTLAMLVDINADGLVDRVTRGSALGEFSVAINRGTSFASATWSGVANDLTGDNSPRGRSASFVLSEFMDLNGDGLPDRIVRGGVQLNNGVNGFGSLLSFGMGSSQDPAAFSLINGQYTAQMVDLNGDGLPDYAVSNGNGTYSAYFNTGRGFSSTAVTWSGVNTSGDGTTGWDGFQSWNGYGTKITFIDMNGDGLPDRVIRNYLGGTDRLLVQLNSGPYPDFLITASNGIGGSVSVNYEPSTSYNNSDGNYPRLPFPLYTVAGITNSDGRGNTSISSYTYAGGYYDTTWKEFRGFAVVTATDPLNAYTTTWFHQGGGTNGAALGEFSDALSKAGLAYRVENYGSDNKLYSRTMNKIVEVRLHPNGVYFSFAEQIARGRR